METRQMIDKVLAYVGQRVNDRADKNWKTLSEHYNMATEARASEDGMIVAIIQGMRNNLYDIQKELGL